ncbi:MAG TPA: DNA-directed RNA polymerase subunit K [Candidatus Nanoarchaeia archaeon]|nr:DNA-directed RNA polymerase subunit K [Candidatus Nanoarchaeia archaeon]
MVKETKPFKYTKYEKARMIGSRALQISMGAPFLVKLTDKELENIRYDPIEISILEFNGGILPITVRRPGIKSREN